MLGKQRNAADAAPGEGSAAARLRDIIRRYYAMWLGYSFASGFLFGVYPLFLRARGLNQFQINSVLAVYFVVMFLTDVPTGAFADAMGRRRSMMLGCGIRTGASIVYFFAHHYLGFVLAETIDGVGTTLCNGAIDAWGVDALDEAGFAGVKDRLFSRIVQLTNVGFMSSAVIGAYVANVNIAWPWLLSAAGFLFVGMAAPYLMREDRGPAIRVDLGALPAIVVARVARGLVQGFRSRTVLLLSTANALIYAAWAPYWIEWPQLFNDTFGVGIWIIGWLYCLFTIARLVGAEAVARMGIGSTQRGSRLASIIVVASVLLAAGGMLAHHPNAALPCLFVMNFGAGAIQPLTQSWFNEQIEAEGRATLLSFSSTFATMGGSLGLLVAGGVADAVGIPVAWELGALVLLAAAPCYWSIRSVSGPATIARAAV